MRSPAAPRDSWDYFREADLSLSQSGVGERVGELAFVAEVLPAQYSQHSFHGKQWSFTLAETSLPHDGAG